MVEVDDLIGVPFRMCGRGPEFYDCYGLVMELKRRECGLILPDYENIRDYVQAAQIISLEKRLWRECECKPGAVPLYYINGLGSHVGYVLDKFDFIHTHKDSGGVTIEPLAVWENRLVKGDLGTGYYEYVGG